MWNTEEKYRREQDVCPERSACNDPPADVPFLARSSSASTFLMPQKCRSELCSALTWSPPTCCIGCRETAVERSQGLEIRQRSSQDTPKHVRLHQGNSETVCHFIRLPRSIEGGPAGNKGKTADRSGELDCIRGRIADTVGAIS